MATGNLTYADLTDAYLAEADLTGTTYNQRTKWPVGFNPLGATFVEY